MKLCPACDRHLFGPEPMCPFCGAEQRTTAVSGGDSVMTSVALAFTLCAAACGPQVLVPVDESTTAASTGPTTPSTTTTNITTGPTIPATTSGPMTEEGPATTTIAASSSSSDDSDDAPCAFYACIPDQGDISQCDLFAQDCPEGEKCVPWKYGGFGGWDGTNCIPIADDPGAAGDLCTTEDGYDDCGEGLLCFGVDPVAMQSTCLPQCGGTMREPTCPEEGQVCSITNDDLLTLCFDACDPLLGDCPEGFGCYPTNDYSEFVCVWTNEAGVYDDPCAYINDCTLGYTCQSEINLPTCEDLACCSPYCDVTLAEPCPEAELGVVCVPWFEDGMAPPGHEDVGVCVLPQ
jgi:hypothetical protein